MVNSGSKLEIKSDLNNLSLIRDFITEVADGVGFSDVEVEELRLAVDEACANVMIHGYGDSDGVLTIFTDPRDGKLTISIHDQAKQFDPIAAGVGTDINAPLDMRALGGMGIIMIKQSADTVEYKRGKNGGNTLILTKNHNS